MKQPALEVAQIFRRYGADYLRAHQPVMTWGQQLALRALSACRTAAMGGHMLECDHCAGTKNAYNSCCNRHCPKCGAAARQNWFEARQQELLPVEYFHSIFTLPARLSPLALQNPQAIYDLLFHSAAETLHQIAANPKHLGAKIGFLAILHTWGERLDPHPHLHCLIPGGGLSPDGSRWIACRPGFFLPVRVLSRKFRGKFLDLLKKLHATGQLQLHGRLTHLRSPKTFAAWLSPLYRTEWVVHARPPFSGSPDVVLKYLARYTNRVAISNHRLVRLHNGQVTFRYKDYARGRRLRTTALEATEFIRRFLMHILPPGFVRIRYFGLLANGTRSKHIEQIRTLLDASLDDATDPSGDQPSAEASDQNQLCQICPDCKKGYLRIRLRTARPTLAQLMVLPVFDSS